MSETMHNVGNHYKARPREGRPWSPERGQKRQLRHIFMPSNKLKNLLNPNNDGDLGELISRAKRMGELTEILSSALPESDRSAIVAANVREDGELVVICASSAWASRLRYETEVLLDAATRAGISAHTCRIRVSQS